MVERSAFQSTVGARARSSDCAKHAPALLHRSVWKPASAGLTSVVGRRPCISLTVMAAKAAIQTSLISLDSSCV